MQPGWRVAGRRRGTLIRLASLEDLARVDMPDGLLVLDLDNTLLPYLPTALDIAQLAPKLTALLDALPRSSTVVVTTNTRRHPRSVGDAVAEAGLTFVPGACKPQPRRLLAAAGDRPTAVVGDQPLTDGLLAWWLGVPFVLVSGCSLRTPWWPRLLRLSGDIVLRFFFSERKDRTAGL